MLKNIKNQDKDKLGRKSLTNHEPRKLFETHSHSHRHSARQQQQHTLATRYTATDY